MTYHNIKSSFNSYCSRKGRYWHIFLNILQGLWYRIRVNDILERSYSVAFNFTLAIFPATIFTFSVIPYIPIQGLVPKLIEFLKEAISETIYGALAPTIQDTLSKQRSVMLYFGVIYSLYLSSNGMMSLLKNFNLADKPSSPYKRNYLQQRAIATLLTLLLTLALFGTLLLLIVARQVLDYMVKYELITSKLQIHMLSSARPIIVLSMFFIAIASIYYLAPTHRPRRKFISIGAMVATMASFLASLAFSYYIQHFVQYGLYGSLGIMIALMTWLLLISLILLVGFELNITLAKVLGTSEQSDNF